MFHQEQQMISFDSSRSTGRLANYFERPLRALLLALCALILFAGAARAQSAADEFDADVNGPVNAVAVQADGKIVIGGSFSTVNGQARGNLARLNPDGSLDAGFTAGANTAVLALLVQADGKIVIGGAFTSLSGQTRNRIGRLNADGTLDGGFNPNANSFVQSLAQQVNGRLIIGGSFTTVGGTAANRVARLSVSGTLDTSFDASVGDGSVVAMAVQPNGMIVLGGSFTNVNGLSRNRLARVDITGALDAFTPNVNGAVRTVALQPGGRILVGGDFTAINGLTRNRLARLSVNGSVDAGFNPNVGASVQTIAVQPDGKFLVGGDFITVGGIARSRLARFDFDGDLDNTLAAAINDVIHAVAVQFDGKIVAGGGFTSVNLQTRNHLARLYANSRLDIRFTAGADDTVVAMAEQPDGKLLVGGEFTTLAGQTRNRIARLNADGSLDSTFNPNANDIIYAIAVQPDGKILVGGNFAFIGGGVHPGLARLNADGTLDASFAAGANNQVHAIVVQPDGKIVIGGEFTSAAGQPRQRLARLNSDGTLDAGFNPGANGTVETLALEADGRIVAGGLFSTLGGALRQNIGRLNGNGTLDSGFNPGVNGAAYALAIQSDGKILVGGTFSTLGGAARENIGRLLGSGLIDSGFNPGANHFVYTLALQADKKIIVGGQFTQFSVFARNHIARISDNGLMDQSFDPGAGDSVYALLVQSDGKVVVGGSFTTLDGFARSRIGRLSNSTAALQDLAVNDAGTTITWMRGGASPEVAKVTFELSTNGVDFSPLAEPSRISGGWQLTGLSLSSNVVFYVRARGFYAGGYATGSGSLVESVQAVYLIPCSFAVSPTTQTAPAAGGSFSLTLTAANQSCQWIGLSNAAWLTAAPLSGTGSGAVGYVVAPNAGAQRTGTMVIAGQLITVTQLGASCPSITVNPSSLADGTIGAAYNQATTATGGVAPYNYTVSVGALPGGVSLNATTGALSAIALTAAGTFNFTIKATDANGCFGTRAYTVTVNPAGGGGNAGLQFYPLPRPVRILDTRAGQGNCDNISTPINGGFSLSTFARLTCEGITIPASAQAIVGNLTIINQTNQIGYLTIYPDGQNAPLASNMIYEPGGILANNFTVGLGANGNFNIFGERTIDAIVDISGYYAPPAAGGLYYHPLSKPVRLLDTRAGQGNCDNVNAPINAGSSLTTLARTSCEGLTIPQAAQSIVGNATVINGSGQVGYLTLYPNGQPVPLASNIVYFPGQILANAFTVSLSATGEFNIFAERTIDMVIDVAGYYSNEANDVNGAGLLFTALATPVRLLDTRAGQGNCDSVNAPIAAGTSLTKLARMTCEGQIIPNNAQAVIGNVTVINGTNQAGYLTLYPTGQAAPLVSNMIYQPSQILSNAFVVGLSGTGQFNIFAERTLEAIVDVSGFFAP